MSHGPISSFIHRSLSQRLKSVLRDHVCLVAGQPCRIANPSPIVLSTGHILLVCTPGNKEVWVFDSSDNGATWSAGVNVTATASHPEWRWVAVGPPQGLQLSAGPHKGRLVVGADHRTDTISGSHSIYSDDFGRTWKISNMLDSPAGPCESQVAPTPNGSLLINARGHDSKRHFAWSDTGGETWGPLTTRPFAGGLRYGGGYCEGSTIALPGGLLAFSTPFEALEPKPVNSRSNMSIFVSRDSGLSWPLSSAINVDPGTSQYSSMLSLNSTHVALVYEGGCLGKRSMPCWIRFVVVNVANE